MKNAQERSRFLLTAGIGATVYYVTLWIGLGLLRIISLDPKHWYPAAVSLALITNTLPNFILQKYWVFAEADKNLQQGALPYVVVAAIFIPLNSFLVWVVVEWTGMYVWIASGLVAIVLIPPSFLVNRRILRKKAFNGEPRNP